MRIRQGVFVIVAAGLTAVLSGCGKESSVNEQLQAISGELQAKRALIVSSDTLKSLTRADIILAIKRESALALIPNIVADLNASKLAKDGHIRFEEIGLEFDDQVLTAKLTFYATLQQFTVKARLEASAFVATTGNSLFWNLYANGFDVLDVDADLAEIPIKKIAMDVDALLPLMNAILDEVVNDNPEKALLTSLDKRGLIDEQLSDASSDEFRFDNKELHFSLQTQASAVLVTPKGIVAVAQVNFVGKDELPDNRPSFPKDKDLVRMSRADWEKQLGVYQQSVKQLVAATMGAEAQPLISLRSSGLAVTKSALARLLNFGLGQGPFSGTAILNTPSESKTDLTFKISGRDCQGYFDGCDFKRICDGDRCERKVKKTVKDMCKVSCCLQTGLIGCIVKSVCNQACNKVVDVVEPIEGASCDTFRAADKLHGGALCGIASNVDKALCDIDANGRKAMCDVEQEVRRFYEKNPIATIKLRVEPNAKLVAVASEIKVADDLSAFDATLAASGGGSVRASIDYDKHNYALDAALPGVTLGLTCATDWKESVETKVEAAPFREPVRFAANWRTENDKSLMLEYRQIGKTVAYVDFSPPPLIELFAGKPHVTINCPLMAAGAAIFGTAEGIFTQQDALQVQPLLSGNDYPLVLEDNTFGIKLPPLKVCPKEDAKSKNKESGKCEAPFLTLYARESKGLVVFTEQ